MRMHSEHIPFNRPWLTGRESENLEEAFGNQHLSGDGPITKKCEAWLQQALGAGKVLLTPSCTAALEMSALLLNLGPGDEVVMPSFTFVSTANAFVLRGCTPVFVDIDSETLNLNPSAVAAAITPDTRAIVPVHYAGIGCDMEALLEIATKHDLAIVEDAAQALGSLHRGKPLGSFGDLATISFHETKNISCGEGGALVVNREDLFERADVLREKGTNRSAFFQGLVDKYTWVDMGSSYLLSEVTAAMLWSQLQDCTRINQRRIEIWNRYHRGLEPLAQRELLRRPVCPTSATHNGHLYYIILPPHLDRASVLSSLNARGVNAVFHYVPLHSAPAGQRYGRSSGQLEHTEELSRRLIRLPLWMGMSDQQVDRVLATLEDVLG